MKFVRLTLLGSAVTAAAALSACASVTSADLYKMNYGLNVNPQPDISSPWGPTNGRSYAVPQSSCVMSNYRCSSRDQLRWAEESQQ